jgi:uncharacterized protein (DUF58 family)
LQARLVVEGFISGSHRSPFHGFSVEFAEHREYAPGDDIRHLDWKVLGRTDRLYIKQYEVETNLRCLFLVDISESMGYQHGAPLERLGKFHYAACLASALAMLLLNQQDAVGLATFDDQLRANLACSASPNQIKSFVHELDGATLRQKTDLEPMCRQLAESMPRRGLICLVSDLLMDADALFRALAHFRSRQQEIMILHVMDEDELQFPFEGSTLFEGLEAAGRLNVEPRALREGYLAALKEFCSSVQRRCSSERIDYRLVSTGERMDAALSAFLAARLSAMRKFRRKGS